MSGLLLQLCVALRQVAKPNKSWLYLLILTLSVMVGGLSSVRIKQMLLPIQTSQLAPKDLMDRSHSSLPEVEEACSDAVPAPTQGIKGSRTCDLPTPPIEEATEKHYRTLPPTPYVRPTHNNSAQLQKQGQRARRYALYEDVRTLATQGVGIRAIARRLKVSRHAIRRFLQAEEYPEIASSRREPRGCILDQYKPYTFQRCQQGCRNSVQLYDEIKARGYSRSTSLLRNFLASVRKKHVEADSAEVLTFDASTQTIDFPADLPTKATYHASHVSYACIPAHCKSEGEA